METKENRVVDADLEPCPLCGHDAVMEVGVKNAGGTESDQVRCLYCGCRLAAPNYGKQGFDANVKYLERHWNNRVMFCRYCGAAIGAARTCPDCGMPQRSN